MIITTIMKKFIVLGLRFPRHFHKNIYISLLKKLLSITFAHTRYICHGKFKYNLKKSNIEKFYSKAFV